MKDIVTVIRSNPEAYAPQLMQQAAEEIELLRIGVATALKERDEARWRLCKVVADNRDIWGDDVAKEYGWAYLAEDSK